MRKILAFLVLCGMTGVAMAQTWSSRPSRLVIPFSPGGGADIAGRLLAQELGDELKQTVIEKWFKARTKYDISGKPPATIEWK